MSPHVYFLFQQARTQMPRMWRGALNCEGDFNAMTTRTPRHQHTYEYISLAECRVISRDQRTIPVLHTDCRQVSFSSIFVRFCLVIYGDFATFDFCSSPVGLPKAEATAAAKLFLFRHRLVQSRKSSLAKRFPVKRIVVLYVRKRTGRLLGD